MSFTWIDFSYAMFKLFAHDQNNVCFPRVFWSKKLIFLKYFDQLGGPYDY